MVGPWIKTKDLKKGTHMKQLLLGLAKMALARLSENDAGGDLTRAGLEEKFETAEVRFCMVT